MNAIRPAAVAGHFYPRDPRELQAEISGLLDGVEQLEPRLDFPKALIVPHAGYIYSGAVAAHAYDALLPARGVVKRVVLLGPTHRVAVRGLAVPSVDSFETPLGPVSVDREAIAAVSGMPQVQVNDSAHTREHALEVQLPFLQCVLGEFSLVPFAVGDTGPEAIAEVLGRLWGGRETILVLSTDLSHYRPYDEAKRIDQGSIRRIGALRADLTHEEACGATPLNGLLLEAHRRGMSIRLLSACNSGDAAGGRQQVVGYCAFGLYEPGTVSLDEAGPILVGLARAAIARDLGQPQGSQEPSPGWLGRRGASFVTLKRDGQLRGCIGSLAATRALAEDVAANARAAAFHDPRFAPLAVAEWKDIQVEVSLLSDPKPIRFADEDELLTAIVPGEDGLILECDGRRATFLPQVWSELPDKRAFLGQLLRKAGLSPDTRLARCRVSRYRVHKWIDAVPQRGIA